jgi:hypothetical protein
MPPNGTKTMNAGLGAIGLVALIVLFWISQRIYDSTSIISDDQLCINCGDTWASQSLDMVKQILSQANTACLAILGGLAFVSVKTPQYASGRYLYFTQRILHLVTALASITGIHYTFVLTHILSVRLIDKIPFIGSASYTLILYWIYYPVLVSFLALVLSILLLSFDRIEQPPIDPCGERSPPTDANGR